MGETRYLCRRDWTLAQNAKSLVVELGRVAGLFMGVAGVTTLTMFLLLEPSALLQRPRLLSQEDIIDRSARKK
eukprot:g44551.t1